MTQTCPLCSSIEFEILSRVDRKKQPLTTVCCIQCGLVVNMPIPEDVDLREFYAHSYRLDYKKSYQPKKKHHVRYFQRAIQQIMQHPLPYQRANNILDIGSGSGEFAVLMQHTGKSVSCIEPNIGYAEYTKQKFDLQVHADSVDNFETEQKFDLIRLSHVAEHFRDPADKLRRIAKWLAPGGQIFIECPDFGNYCRTKSPGNIFHYGHIFNFDKTTLPAMMALAGLKAVYKTSATSIYCVASEHAQVVIEPENATHNIKFFNHHIAGQYQNFSRRISKLTGKIGKIAYEAFISATTNDVSHIAGIFCRRFDAKFVPTMDV